MKNEEKKSYVKETIEFLVGKGLEKKDAKAVCGKAYNILRDEVNKEKKEESAYV